jgi:hypothetical protein
MGLPMIPSFFFFRAFYTFYRNPHDLHGKNVVKTHGFWQFPPFGTGSIVSSAAVIGAVHRS